MVVTRYIPWRLSGDGDLMCSDCANLYEDLRAAEWDIRTLEDDLEKLEHEARRLQATLGEHACVDPAGYRQDGS